MAETREESKSAVCGSFWAEGNYRRTTRRVEDGYRLCGDLVALVGERAELERAYGRSLRAWADKWSCVLERGPEYGTTEGAVRGLLLEADRRCNLHVRLREDLCRLAQDVRHWQRETYHKSLLQIRERKELETAFKRAQRPWAKVLNKVNKAKSDYYNACKAEKSVLRQEPSASGDSSLPEDKMKKIQDKIAKTKNDVQKCKEKYEEALNDLTNCNSKYIEDMTDVFKKCQTLEAHRLQFFKGILFSLHKCLNISQDPQFAKIYEDLHSTISNADHEADLKWWSDNHGVNMMMNWPKFEDYGEELKEGSK